MKDGVEMWFVNSLCTLYGRVFQILNGTDEWSIFNKLKKKTLLSDVISYSIENYRENTYKIFII